LKETDRAEQVKTVKTCLRLVTGKAADAVLSMSCRVFMNFWCYLCEERERLYLWMLKLVYQETSSSVWADSMFMIL